MQFSLRQYERAGREAALALAHKRPHTAGQIKQWAASAMQTEHEPDRILAQAAYDRGYQTVQRQQAEFAQARRRA